MFLNIQGPVLGSTKLLRRIRLNEDQERDILNMFGNVPVIHIALKHFLAMSLSKPFTVKIPKLKLQNDEDLSIIIERKWLPWLRMCYIYSKIYGVIPYWIVRKKDSHPYPRCPELGSGFISVYFDERTKENEYDYTWRTSADGTPDKSMLWFKTEERPMWDGTIRSPLSTLLHSYRTVLKQQHHVDVYSTQAAHPVHLFIPKEFNQKTQGRDTNFQLFAPQFQAAAGIAERNLKALQEEEIRNQTRDVYKQLQQIRDNNLRDPERFLWSETPAKAMAEMNAGFPDRTIVGKPGYGYEQAAGPKPPHLDFIKLLDDFDIRCAAIMDFTMELLKPSGSSRAQNLESARKFENDRVSDKTNQFVSWVKDAFAEAYKDRLDQPMKKNGLAVELDIEVDMSITAANTVETFKDLYNAGLISQKTFGVESLKMLNMPETFLELSDPQDIKMEKLKQKKRKVDGQH